MSAGTQTVLERIVAETRAEVQRRKRAVPQAALEADAPEAGRRPFREALRGAGVKGPSAGVEGGRGADVEAPRAADVEAPRGAGVAVIAEFKRRSPSAGPLRERPDLRTIVSEYERGGASALSILTEGPNFGGSLDDLRAAKAACGLPVLRKDFVVDPYQLHEARAAGADAALLIVAALSQGQLCELHELALELGLDALVEVHDEDELRRARDAGASLIGVNNRDLRDFSVDVQRTFALLEHMPPGATVVSESGIHATEQLRELGERGVHAVLVGEALMRAAFPQRALEELRKLPARSPQSSTGRNLPVGER